eukprot:896086_1
MALRSILILSFIIHIASSQKGGGGGRGGGGRGGRGNGGSSTNSPTTSSTTTGSTSSTRTVIASPPPPGSTINECERHRKPWHELSVNEQQLYIDGFLELARLGKMSIFTQQHASDISGPQAHSTAAFLPWHRYFLIEVENAFRSLGPNYQCFALPYWDWSYETTLTSNISEFIILNSGLGHFGDPGNYNCLNDDNFGQGNYQPHYCGYNVGECCLTRGNCQEDPDNVCVFQTPQQMIDVITRTANNVYGTDQRNYNNGYRYNLEAGSHGQAHIYMGSGGHLSNLNFSPDDPIFYLLHSFVDYQWSLWADCKDYDLVDKLDIIERIYGGSLDEPGIFTTRGPSGADDDLIFDILRSTEWTILSQQDDNYTPRDMHNISDWSISYEKGSFWDLGDVDTACPIINEKWFYETNDNELPLQSSAFVFGKYIPGSVGMEDNILDETPRQKARRKAKESYSGRYAQDSIILLKDKYKWRTAGVLKDIEMIHTWSEMTCEFNQLSLQKSCKRPRYFDDCEDMIINQQTDDIDITLNELIDKVIGSDCMIAARRQFYDWAMKTHTLRGLCRGDYDIFCDDDFKIEKEQEETCIGNIGKVIQRQAKNKKGDNIINSGHSLLNNNLDLFGSHYENNVNNEISEMQKIMLSAVINGLVIIFII